MRRITAALCAVLLLAAGPSIARADIQPRSNPSWDQLRMVSIGLNETQFMLKAARSMLEEKTSALPNAGVPDMPMPKVLSERDERWIFLTLFSPGKSPLTVATHKKSIIGSLAACAELALGSEKYAACFADRLDQTQILLDFPTLAIRVWPTTMKTIASEFDPSAFGLFVSSSNAQGFILPAQYFASGTHPRDYRDRFLKRFDIEGREFLKRGGAVYMFSINSQLESSPGGLIVPIVRGNLLRLGASGQLIDARIAMAVKFLIAHQRKDGSFFTERNPRNGINSLANYDTRRHAEATAALVEYAGNSGFQQVRRASAKAVDFLLGKCERGWHKEQRFLYIPNPQGRADLGATATATAVLAMDAAATGTHDNDPVIRSLLEFVLFMQVFNGDFRQYYPQPQTHEENPPRVSPFIGQAVCALIEGAARFSDDPRFGKALNRTAKLILDRPDDFMKSRVAAENTWLLRGLLKLSRYYRGRSGQEQVAENLLQLAVRLSASLLNRQYNSGTADFPDQVGGFRAFSSMVDKTDQYFAELSAIEKRLRVEPSSLVTAGVLEGIALVAAERAKESVPSRVILTSLRNAADFLVREQYDEMNTYYFRNPKRAVGGVRTTVDNSTIRIETMALFIRSLMAARKVVTD